MIEKDQINILANMPVEVVARRLGLSVRNHKSICPFHRDTHPSLTFNTSRNRYRCYACDAHGGTIDLVMNMLKMPFDKACRWLADGNNMVLISREPMERKERKTIQLDLEWLALLVDRRELNEEAKRFLFDTRRINPRVVEWAGLSSISSPQPCWRFGRPFYDAPSLLIPYRDINGCLLSVQSRYLGNASDGLARFKFPKGSRCTVYNMPVLAMLKDCEPLYITEGVSDCLAMLSAGHKAIAIPSATMLTNADKHLLAGLATRLHTPFHMYPDNDEPGENLFKQLDELLGKATPLVRHQLPEGCKDFGEAWAKSLIC